ncbi:MAG: LURP-one-related/scramblase family protein [Candidatus Nanohaloarchaea archaeon]
MEQQELENWIENAFQDGYSIDEINRTLQDEGVDQKRIQQAVHDLRRKLEQGQDPSKPTGETGDEQVETVSQTDKDVIGGVDLSGDVYRVRQNFILNRYKVWDDDDELILRAKQKLFRLKEKVPFYNADGDVVFRVKGQKIIDVAGDYAVVDEESGDKVAVLKRNYTIFTHHWKIKSGDSDERLLANVESANEAVAVLRVLGGFIPVLPNIFAFIPHSYVIKNPDDREIGRIKGKFSIRDAYSIEIDDPEDIPKESLVAASIAIDALEGN